MLSLQIPLLGRGSGYSGLRAAQVCLHGLVRIRTNAGAGCELECPKMFIVFPERGVFNVMRFWSIGSVDWSLEPRKTLEVPADESLATPHWPVYTYLGESVDSWPIPLAFEYASCDVVNRNASVAPQFCGVALRRVNVVDATAKILEVRYNAWLSSCE